MDKQHILSFLQDSPFMDNLSLANLTRLAEMAELVTIPADTRLLTTGDDAQNLSIVYSGKVRLGIVKDEEFTVIDTLTKHRIIGWSAVIPPYKWSFDAITENETLLVRFNGARLRKMCREETDFGVELMTCMVKAVTRRLNATRMALLDHSC